MKVVLLAGGYGTRFMEQSEFKPKPMIEIGEMPILWHVMKEYYSYGFDEFIICAGYKQEYIKKWFRDYYFHTSDITFDFKTGNNIIVHDQHAEAWTVTVVDTGLDTMTGGRIKRIQDYINGEDFMMTYGDGVCDVNISDLLNFHKSHGKMATITSVTIDQDKGILDINADGSVRSFREKNNLDKVRVNAGYMVLKPDVFDYIEGDKTSFEKDTLTKLTNINQVMSFEHHGYWQCMDTKLEYTKLVQLWDAKKAPWKNW